MSKKGEATNDADVFITPRQAAQMLELTEGTLAMWRHSKTHPLPFIRLGHQVVRYNLSDIQCFLAERTVRPQAKKGATK